MRVIQLTDLHIGFENEHPYHVDVRGNFLKILSAIAKEHYDLLCITGDLCLEKPDKKIYHWIKSVLDASIDSQKTAIIAGNHDDAVLLANSFGLSRSLTGAELFFDRVVDGQSCIMLDTAIGSMSPKQMDWFKTQIEATEGRFVNIFMHHPPSFAKLPFMDENHAYREIGSFQSLLCNYQDKRFNIFCGHYHTERTIQVANMSIFITPSCYVQIDSNHNDFVPDHYKIGYRIIDLDITQVTTWVKYLN